MLTKENSGASSFASVEELEKLRSTLDSFIVKQEEQNKVLESSLDKILTSLNNLATSSGTEDKASAFETTVISPAPLLTTGNRSVHVRHDVSRAHQQVDTPPPGVTAQIQHLEGTPWFTKAPSPDEDEEGLADCPWTAKQLEDFFLQANPAYGHEQDQFQDEDFFARQQVQHHQNFNQAVNSFKPYTPQHPPNKYSVFQQQMQMHQKIVAKGPKLSFPEFDGTDSDGWIRKAELFFELVGVPNEQSVHIAVMYIVGKAEYWWRGTGCNANSIPWHQFCRMLTDRFNEESSYEVIASFMA